MKPVLALVGLLVACGHPRPQQTGDAAGGGADSSGGQHDAAVVIDATGTRDGGGGDAGGTRDGGGTHDGGGAHDAGGASDGPSGGIISGGPCISGATGATGFRIRWAGQSGSSAYVVYEKDGMPQGAGDRAGAYGYQIGFTPSFVDPFLGDGGLALDDSDFIDMYVSTAGVSSITKATLSIYGRSYNTTASGSFNWQSLDDAGSTPDDLVSNVAPYQWYSADMTSAIGPGESGYLLRIKSGPSSDALVVNRVELCLVAQ